MNLHHVALAVEDLDSAVAFYTDRLGLRLREDRPDPTSERGACLSNGSFEIHLTEGMTPSRVGQHFAITVEDLASAIEELRHEGIDVRGPSAVGIGDLEQAFVADPSGNWVELRENG